MGDELDIFNRVFDIYIIEAVLMLQKEAYILPSK